MDLSEEWERVAKDAWRNVSFSELREGFHGHYRELTNKLSEVASSEDRPEDARRGAADLLRRLQRQNVPVTAHENATLFTLATFAAMRAPEVERDYERVALLFALIMVGYFAGWTGRSSRPARMKTPD